ncbi:MAG: paraquat-inducible protein A [Phycisphaerales bacterium]|nr:paraquat-inducible protein A [Phycisphaerales bacterium]
MDAPLVISCRFCGLHQTVPEVPRGMSAACERCGTPIRQLHGSRRNQTTAALALASLILYPVAVTMPMITVRQLGHQNESSIVEGVTSLLADRQLGVGLIVLLCSVVFPLGKLFALLALTVGGFGLSHRHKALTYAIVQWTGRWGMMDVLLVAILVAALKLGNVMEVTPGPAALAFSTCVILSLLAGASFDPRQIWERER